MRSKPSTFSRYFEGNRKLTVKNASSEIEQHKLHGVKKQFLIVHTQILNPSDKFQEYLQFTVECSV